MPISKIELEVSPTFRGIGGRWVETSEKTINETRQGVRFMGQRWVYFMRKEAPEGKTGNLKKGINYKTFVRGTHIELKGYVPEPITTFITKGTKSYPVSAVRAKALSFFWDKVGMQTFVPKGGGFNTYVSNGVLNIGKGFVQIPAKKANPFDQRALDQWKPEMRTKVSQIARNWQTNFKS